MATLATPPPAFALPARGRPRRDGAASRPRRILAAAVGEGGGFGGLPLATLAVVAALTRAPIPLRPLLPPGTP